MERADVVLNNPVLEKGEVTNNNLRKLFSFSRQYPQRTSTGEVRYIWAGSSALAWITAGEQIEETDLSDPAGHLVVDRLGAITGALTIKGRRKAIDRIKYAEIPFKREMHDFDFILCDGSLRLPDKFEETTVDSFREYAQEGRGLFNEWPLYNSFLVFQVRNPDNAEEVLEVVTLPPETLIAAKFYALLNHHYAAHESQKYFQEMENLAGWARENLPQSLMDDLVKDILHPDNMLANFQIPDKEEGYAGSNVEWFIRRGMEKQGIYKFLRTKGKRHPSLERNLPSLACMIHDNKFNWTNNDLLFDSELMKDPNYFDKVQKAVDCLERLNLKPVERAEKLEYWLKTGKSINGLPNFDFTRNFFAAENCQPTVELLLEAVKNGKYHTRETLGLFDLIPFRFVPRMRHAMKIGWRTTLNKEEMEIIYKAVKAGVEAGFPIYEGMESEDSIITNLRKAFGMRV